MSYFSELLTFYSKRIGVNSPLIASYCGLDRVTVYRFLKGKTLPKDKDTVSKMAEFLHRNAGLPCISVGWGFRPAQVLLDAGAGEILPDVGTLMERLLN